MGLIQGLGDLISGTKIREWSMDLATGQKLKFIIKERNARRFLLMRISSAGDYHYEQFEADEVDAMAEALTALSHDLRGVSKPSS
ncbi:MAG: hypothetical protein ACE37E_17295 [Hyphomicrobiales bacterium]